MDDLISRQETINRLKKPDTVCDDAADPALLAFSFYDICRNSQFIFDKLTIETAPAVKPKRQQGKWRITLDNDEEMYECSVCKCRMIKEPYDLAVGMRGYNYCPYCGAKMTEVKK